MYGNPIARIPVLHDFDPATETSLHLGFQLREIARFHDVRHFFLLFFRVQPAAHAGRLFFAPSTIDTHVFSASSLFELAMFMRS